MSILASLVRAYERMPDAPRLGYSTEKIGYAISLNDDGSVAHLIDLRDGAAKKRQPRMIDVPASFKRPGVTPRAFFLWDNTAFVLGVSADENKDCEARRLAFRDLHFKVLTDSSDTGLCALRSFLERWEPSDFAALKWPEEMKGQNVVFTLESERRERFIHQRDAARALVASMQLNDGKNEGVCLVTGGHAPVARLHPAIKGVWGGQVAGGSIVSFNLDAFTSYGHEQGDNAPVSEAAAFAYTTALNRFLERDRKHRVQIGDASTIFWADASDITLSAEAEGVFFAMFSDPGEAGDDEEEAKNIAILLERLRKGEQIESLNPRLSEGVRFHVLGLAPNAARISIRFYYENDFRELARNYQRFVEDMRIEPPPREPYPPLWRYLVETAVLGKRENVPPNLAGEWMRTILVGVNYPLTLLATVLSRIRADGDINALRAGMMRALLVRNFRMNPESGDKTREAPVSFDPENKNKGYLLGRLFAVYEQAQSAALGRNVNATIKDKFYGSASATPRNVFALLERGSANHLAKVGKERPGQRVNLEKAIGAIMEAMSPGEDPFPKSLGAEEQAMFGLGYYHQRAEFFRKRESGAGEAVQ